MQQHALLILGAGWSSTFLLPLCAARNLPVAATTRDGRDVASHSTVKWTFDPEGSHEQFTALPLAKTLLVTFPLTGKGQSKLIKKGYESVWGSKLGDEGVRVVQLGSTGIWQITQSDVWIDRKSPYNTENARGVAEDELLELGGSVLNLAGLWGGPRDPKTWVSRVAKTKEDVKGKKSLHMVHGMDVARAVLAVMDGWDKAKGQRWMLTDGFVYDWWALMAGWADVGSEGESAAGGEVEAAEGKRNVDRDPANTAKWVYELMQEEDVKALPRSSEVLGRCYDSREFWETFGLAPLKARI